MNRIRSLVDEALRESEDEEGMQLFELDVPDHLPSSPLCPLNPNHKSGGKAICPMHGRKRTVAITSVEKTGQKQGKQAPRIVYESGPQGDKKSRADSKDVGRKSSNHR